VLTVPEIQYGNWRSLNSSSLVEDLNNRRVDRNIDISSEFTDKLDRSVHWLYVEDTSDEYQVDLSKPIDLTNRFERQTNFYATPVQDSYNNYSPQQQTSQVYIQPQQPIGVSFAQPTAQQPIGVAYAQPTASPQDCYVQTDCSSSCGEGFQLLIPNQSPTCISFSLQVLPCKIGNCPSDCKWGPWQSWSACAQRGLECRQYRTRSRARPATNGGRDCRGQENEQRFCVTQTCRGYPGVAGPQGRSGSPGRDGFQGAPGSRGQPGQQGQAGKPGSNGSSGSDGKNGVNGAPGPQGFAGQLGKAGRPGAMGPGGPTGKTGNQGVRGNFGAVGPVGPEGSRGSPGGPGQDGKSGGPGPPGSQGLFGAPGSLGPTGMLGVRGEQGLPGSNGPRGQTGPKGPPGDAFDSLPTYGTPEPPLSSYSNTVSSPPSFYPNKKKRESRTEEEKK